MIAAIWRKKGAIIHNVSWIELPPKNVDQQSILAIKEYIMTIGGRNMAQWPASIRFKIHAAAVCAWLTPSIDRGVFGGCLSHGYLVSVGGGGGVGGSPSRREEAFKVVEAGNAGMLPALKPVAKDADARKTTKERKFVLDQIIFRNGI